MLTDDTNDTDALLQVAMEVHNVNGRLNTAVKLLQDKGSLVDGCLTVISRLFDSNITVI